MRLPVGVAKASVFSFRAFETGERYRGHGSPSHRRDSNQRRFSRHETHSQCSLCLSRFFRDSREGVCLFVRSFFSLSAGGRRACSEAVLASAMPRDAWSLASLLGPQTSGQRLHDTLAGALTLAHSRGQQEKYGTMRSVRDASSPLPSLFLRALSDASPPRRSSPGGCRRSAAPDRRCQALGRYV